MPTTPKRSSARCWPQGYSQVETPEEAGLVLYNTCSIRDKAEQKVFNRLQNFKREGRQGQDLRRARLRRAAGRREDLRPRAARVSLVAGSASYTQLRRDAGATRSGNRRVTGLSLDTDETFDTPFTRRDNPHRAYITIIEGCDKSCAYCVVPFTRGPERSRTSESVMAEARGLADAGYTEIQLLGQNVNSYRDPSPAGWDFATLLGRVGRDSRHPPRALHHLASARFRARPSSTPWTPIRRSAITSICPCSPVPPACSAPMDRLYTRDEYMRRIEWMKNAQAPLFAITTDIIVGFPGETEEDFQADARPARRSAVRFALQLQVLAAPQHRRARAWKTAFRKKRSSAAC